MLVHRRARPLLLLAAAVAVTAAPQVAAQRDSLTVERIFASGDFRPHYLPAVQWMRDRRRFSFVIGNDTTRATDLVAEDAATGTRTRLIAGAELVPPGRSTPIEIEDYQWSADERKLLIFTDSKPVWRQNTQGLFYVFDLATRRLQPISAQPGMQQFAKLSPDGTRVGFVRARDLYVTDLASGRETRLTRDGSDTIINGTFDWVYEEELDLRDGWRWSPDGREIAFWRIDASRERPFTLLNETDSIYNRTTAIPYPKAGEANPVARIGVIAATGGPVTWMDTGADSSVYLARMDWTGVGDELMVQRLNRAQNRLDVLVGDGGSAAMRRIFTDSSRAWVDVDNDYAFVRGGRQLLWTSERSGRNQLYLISRDGTAPRQLTRAEADVAGVVGVDEPGGWIYFSAAAPTPRERQIFRVRFDGSGLARLTTDSGTHDAALSPGSPYFIDVYSQAGVPPRTLLRATSGRELRVLEDNAAVRRNLAALRIRKPEFLSFRTADGVEMNGWIIKPPDFDPAKKYPLLMYVYGGPGSQTVLDAWGGTRYLWHQLLTQRGYIVASVDNRGTGARGAAFKQAVYRQLGKVETADQIAAARYFASLPYVNPTRLGIWGWSYGGYMTALTLTRPASVFKAGIAVAPVTDWRFYDSIYTERFMGLPAENAAGYADSPVANAANLKGNFLLIHGTGDDNVHFQNSLTLVNALQAAGKQFDFMAYPNRTHSISGGRTSVHLFTLMTRWLEENL